MALERRPDANEFLIGVYSEPKLLDLKGMELVIGDIPMGRQFNALRYCGNYTQAAKVMFLERASRMGEIRTAEACREDSLDASKIAGVRAVKPADPVCHDIRLRTDLARSGEAEYERLLVVVRRERERQEAQYPGYESDDTRHPWASGS